MNKYWNWALLMLVALVTLASCEKDDPVKMIEPRASIVFDDNIDKASASYRIGSPLVLKITIRGSASAVRVSSQYSASGQTRIIDLGTLQLTDNVATLNIPVSSLRGAGDGPVAAGTSYQLLVDAVTESGTERRILTAAIIP